MVEREPIGDAAAAIVPDQAEPLEAEHIGQLDDVRRQLPLAVTLAVRPAGRSLRRAVAAQIGRDDAVRARQARHDPAPAVVRLREPMQQQDRRTGARHRDAVGSTADFDPAVAHPRHRAGNHLRRQLLPTAGLLVGAAGECKPGSRRSQSLGTMSPGPALRITPLDVSLNSRLALPASVVNSSPRGLNVPEILPMTEALRLTMTMSRVLSDTKRVPLYRPHPEGASAVC